MGHKIGPRIINGSYLNHPVPLICRGCLKYRVEKESGVTSRGRRKTARIDGRQRKEQGQGRAAVSGPEFIFQDHTL